MSTAYMIGLLLIVLVSYGCLLWWLAKLMSGKRR